MDILRKIEEYAIAQSERTAFRSRNGEISYGELWERSGRLASEIENLMCDSRDPVIVYGHKDPMMIVCFIACVRSGRAYCPIDINTPAQRIAQISEKIGKPLVIMAEKTSAASEIEKREMFTGSRWLIGYETIRELTKSGKITTALSPCSDENDFYIIFTSGTTGKPKGVRITANDLNNYLDWAVSLAGGIKEHSVFMNQAPYSFDLSVMDLYLSLATGGTVVSVDHILQKDNCKLLEYLATQGINYWVSTPSFADICLADEIFDASLLSEMEGFLFCGEVLANRTAYELIKRFPGAKLVNTYGPTESTVCVTEVNITEEMAAGSEPLPVGNIRPGTTIQLDPDTSEIIIMGDTVSPGYYKEAELTNALFFIQFLDSLCEKPGSVHAGMQGAVRAYRTGDKGHFGNDGLLYCDGRIDNQIKLHGYRIEIEDIESNLSTVYGVKRGAVAQRMRDGKVDSLTAFVIRDGDAIADDYSGRKAVRTALREKLPSYMIPKKIVFLDELPVTSNGKLDRNKLRGMA